MTSVIPADNLRHLVRLRHIAIVGQFCAVAVAAIWLQARLPLSALLTVICLLLLANIATWTWLRSRNQVSPPIIFAHLLVDIAALTALLFLTGGADNPFSGLYLLTVVIAAIALPRAYAWSVAAVTAACYAALFFLRLPLLGPDGDALPGHVIQMGSWLTYALGAALITYFVAAITATLRDREQQLEISRQQRFHHEKMAAIGSLAAAVAHEINNPIAAITGIAQNISDAKQTHICPNAEICGCHPELILDQAKRIASITRQVAELTAPHSPEPELLDLNALVANTCNFISYDQRFRGIDLVLEPDHDLPAIEAVADHLTQVLMNLLINATDALDGATDRKPTIRVVTGAVDGEVLMKVSDNGCGMDRAVLSRAFDDSFTTKPVGKGCGLGLFLCKTLVEQRGGRIELESTPGVGTTAQIWLPLEHQQQIAA